MKTYKDITKRYLSKNKGRTITTICGIILSISLITAIMFFVNGIHQSFINREINASGAYHIGFTGLSKDEYSKMGANAGVKNVGVLNDLGVITENNGNYDYKFALNEVTKGQEDLFPYDVLEGRFGENQSEIAVDSKTLKEMNKSIGDSTVIDVNGKRASYKIVGIIDNMDIREMKQEGIVLISRDDISLGENTLTAFEGKSNGLRKTLNELKTMTNKEAVENEYYLAYIGAGDNMERNIAIFSMAAIIISLVIVSTVLVIKNAFYISIVSRLKEFGLLKSIGATSKQLRAMILKEANIIALIAIPFGLFFGTLAIIVVEKILAMMSENILIIIKIEWWILVIGAILGFVTTYICAFLPALELKRISPLAAIDNRTGIKKEKIKRRKSNVVEKFLNIRTIMAYRNIKRNKRRYNSTILGLTVSMVLFIVFTSYMRIVINDTLGYTDASTDIPDITSHVTNSEPTKISALLDELYKIEGINILETNNLGSGLLGQIINKDNLNKNIFSDDEKINNIDKLEIDKNYDIITPPIYSTNLNENITSFFNKYLVDGKIDLEYMKNNNGIIVVDQRVHFLDSGKYRGGISNLKVGDKVYLNKFMDIVTNEDRKIKKIPKEGGKEFEVIATVGELPSGLESYDYIVDNNNIKSLLGEEYEDVLGTSSVQIRVTDNENKEAIIKKVQDIFKKYNMDYSDIKEMMKENTAFINQIKFLVYGFIVVLGLISCTNIFNTMSTNILFRRREIAALRAIGMSKKEMRNMIIKEGALYGVISIFYAAIIGTVINFMLYRQLVTITNFKFTMYFDSIIVVGIIGTLVGIIASLIPLKKVEHWSIIEDLKSE